jgi:NADP-dependent 3-hydroxy acid dehydrogenase YdfG
MKISLITGATSGFGRAIALRFAREGYAVIITGRREDRLDALKLELQKKYKARIKSLAFDVRKLQAARNALNSLPETWRKIDVLVNNAGLAAGLQPVHEGAIDDWEQMIDTNIKGLLYMIRLVAPGMAERRSGHIINIGSIAGREVYPNGNVYCGSKFAVDAISKGTRIDLVQYGIRVTQILPGAADTEFSLVRFKGDRKRASMVYQGFIPLTADDIAEVTWYVTTLPPRVNINELVIMPTAQANATTFFRTSPA